jgi:alginate O-acetyltransferase complex protein AlgI
MDAMTFLTGRRGVGAWNLKFHWPARRSSFDDGGRLDVGAWCFAALRTLTGIGLIWLAIRLPLLADTAAAGWLAMVGIVLFLHFGVFDLLALAWRSAGVNVLRVMRAPLRATSLADFWSRRWNTAFHTLAHELIFRPVARRVGVARATFAVFLISGLVHDAVNSLPARGGFGLPTAYFVLQAFGVLAERSAVGRRLKLGKGARGWLYVILFTAGPVFWLFHPPFIKHVILPMLRAFGAS